MATTITANGINFPDGSASAPSIGGTDTNTGLFTGSDIVGFATGGTERIRIDANGKVCINNDTALSDLHICTAGSSEQDGTLRLGGSAASLGLVLDYDQASATVSRITANPTYSNDDSLLKICVDGDANPNQLVLRGDGNIGIGINDTSADLQIVGSSSAGLLRVGGNQTNGVGLDISYNNSSTTTTTFKQNYRATNAGALIKFDSGYFTFHTGTAGGEKLRITSAGYVGIGVTSPNKTGIQNNVSVLQIDSGDGAELILGNSVSSNVSTNHIGAIAFKNIDSSTGSAPHYAGIRCNCTDTSGNMNLKFYAGGGGGTGFEDDTPDMLIDSIGRVGIGTANPSATSISSNTVNGVLHIDSSGADSASAIKLGGKDGNSNSNYAQIGWAGADNRLDFTVNGNQALQIEPDKDVKIVDGNLIIGNSGHGIDFSASASASGMTSELLADYEHGTWDPAPNTSNPSWLNKDGTYVRIGSLVHCDMWLRASGTSSSTSQVICSLPFAACDESNTNARPTTAVGRVYNLRNWGSNGNAFGWVGAGSSNLNFMWNNNGANPGELSMNVWQSGAEIHASITYRTNV